MLSEMFTMIILVLTAFFIIWMLLGWRIVPPAHTVSITTPGGRYRRAKGGPVHIMPGIEKMGKPIPSGDVTIDTKKHPDYKLPPIAMYSTLTGQYHDGIAADVILSYSKSDAAATAQHVADEDAVDEFWSIVSGIVFAVLNGRAIESILNDTGLDHTAIDNLNATIFNRLVRHHKIRQYGITPTMFAIQDIEPPPSLTALWTTLAAAKIEAENIKVVAEAQRAAMDLIGQDVHIAQVQAEAIRGVKPGATVVITGDQQNAILGLTGRNRRPSNE